MIHTQNSKLAEALYLSKIHLKGTEFTIPPELPMHWQNILKYINDAEIDHFYDLNVAIYSKDGCRTDLCRKKFDQQLKKNAFEANQALDIENFTGDFEGLKFFINAAFQSGKAADRSLAVTVKYRRLNVINALKSQMKSKKGWSTPERSKGSSSTRSPRTGTSIVYQPSLPEHSKRESASTISPRSKTSRLERSSTPESSTLKRRRIKESSPLTQTSSSIGMKVRSAKLFVK